MSFENIDKALDIEVVQTKSELVETELPKIEKNAKINLIKVEFLLLPLNSNVSSYYYSFTKFLKRYMITILIRLKYLS